MRTRRSIVAVTALAVAAGVGVTACGGSSGSSSKTAATAAPEVSPAGDIPDTQAFVPFSPPSGGYSIQVPEGWARTDLATGATFTDKLNSIRVEASAASAAPDTGSIKTVDVPALQSSVAGFALGQISTVTRTAGDGVLLTYQGAGAPDAVTGKSVTQDVERYQFWKAGNLVTITLTSPRGADNVDPWKTVTNSFGWQ